MKVKSTNTKQKKQEKILPGTWILVQCKQTMRTDGRDRKNTNATANKLNSHQVLLNYESQ